ncbi:hypothetical protein ABVK25_003890 [Lepraria finkii]|uniref:TNT domain-containing protein n=1 Tax=Lepraria finkii TaxID=1340010 RepID=A0ABR4BCT0_9LECA
MHWKCLLLTALGVSYEVSATFHQEAPLLLTATDNYNCTGITNTSHTDKYVCGDERLGPKDLPNTLPLLDVVYKYHPFGKKTPREFLNKWTHHDGSYKYPLLNGFQLDIDGVPILGNMTLVVGTTVDRFGSESGQYVSAADAPFSQRSLPPSSLDAPVNDKRYPYNYHIYTVNREFTVIGGPIAPWFDQPGLGAQYFLGATETINGLKEKGYLKELNLTELGTGPDISSPYEL